MESVVTERRRNPTHPRRCSGPLATALLLLTMTLVAVITIVPFVIMVVAALTPRLQFLVFPEGLIPETVGFDNFTRLIKTSMAGRWLLNSLFVTTTSTVIMVITSSMAGYAFARGDFIGKNLIFTLFTGILMVPMTLRVVPLFVILSKLRWVNTLWALMGPWIASIFGTYMLRQHYMSIPKDYDEAAVIDGASVFQIYYYILLPQIKPAIVSLATLRFIQHWNDFIYPMMINSRSEVRTITVGLATLVRRQSGVGFIMAGAVLGFLPTLIVFLLTQGYVTEGSALTGLKA